MPQPVRVAGNGGWRGIVHSWFGEAGRDGREITIRLDTGETVVVPDTALEGRPDGSYYVPLALDQIRGAAPAAGSGTQTRVHKTSRTEEQMVDVPLIREEVEIERVRVDRIVEGPVAVRQEGDTIVVPVVEEVLVVEKQLRLVEEVRIRKTRTEKREPQRVVLRKEEARVDQGEADGAADDVRAF